LKHFPETMIQLLEVVTVFAFCCLLNVGVTFGRKFLSESLLNELSSVTRVC